MEIKVLVNGNAATAAEHPDILLTSGCENAVFVALEPDSSWDGFSADAVFVAAPASWVVTRNPCTATVVSLPLVSNSDESARGAYLPAEFFQHIGAHIFAGLTGVQGDTVKNSDLALLGVVVQGADPELGENGDLSPTRYALLSSEIGDLSNLDTEDKSSLVAAINEVFAKPSGGGGGGGTGTVNSVNGKPPDGQGNVDLAAEDVGAASAEALTEQAIKLTQLSETVSTQGTSITSLSNTTASQGKKITTLESTTSNQGKRIEALEEAPSSSPFYITMGEQATDVGEEYYKVDKTAEEIEAAYASGVEMYLKEAYNGTVLGKLPLVTRLAQDASQRIYAFIGNDYSGSINEVLAYLFIAPAFDYPVVQLEHRHFNKVSSINGKTPKSDGTLTLAASDVGAVSTDDFAPEAKTEDMTQAVGVDEAGKLWTLPGGGGGSSEEKSWKLIRDITLEEDTGSIVVNLDDDGNAFSCEEIFIHTSATNIADTTEALHLTVKINGNNTMINSTVNSICFTCGKTGTSGRAWSYIKSINPLIVFYGSWIGTNISYEKPITTTTANVGREGNPFAIGEKIQSITLGANVSNAGIGAGSRFEIYGR